MSGGVREPSALTKLKMATLYTLIIARVPASTLFMPDILFAQLGWDRRRQFSTHGRKKNDLVCTVVEVLDAIYNYFMYFFLFKILECFSVLKFLRTDLTGRRESVL